MSAVPVRAQSRAERLLCRRRFSAVSAGRAQRRDGVPLAPKRGGEAPFSRSHRPAKDCPEKSEIGCLRAVCSRIGNGKAVMFSLRRRSRAQKCGGGVSPCSMPAANGGGLNFPTFIRKCKKKEPSGRRTPSGDSKKAPPFSKRKERRAKALCRMLSHKRPRRSE